MAKKYSEKAQSKIHTVMSEFKEGTLHAGKTGKPVKSRAQAVAIALSEARKRGYKVPKLRKKSYSHQAIAQARSSRGA